MVDDQTRMDKFDPLGQVSWGGTLMGGFNQQPNLVPSEQQRTQKEKDIKSAFDVASQEIHSVFDHFEQTQSDEQINQIKKKEQKVQEKVQQKEVLV